MKIRSFKYKTSVPFLRWFWAEENKRDLYNINHKPGVLTELLVGLILLLTFNSWSQTPQSAVNLIIFLLWVVIVFVLATLALVNVKTMLLPDVLTRPLTLIVIVFQLIVAAQTGNAGIIGSAIVGALILGGVPYVLFLISQGRWIGGGDVKLGLAAGLLLGWKLGSLCLGVLFLLALISRSAEHISSRATKTYASSRIGTGVIWVASIFIALVIGQRVLV